MNNEIIKRLERIETKLDELIAALHNYDDGLEMFDDEPKRIPPCVGHDEASWNEEEAELNKRMDVIGQNGNEGLHYDEGEFDDYGQRVVKDKDNNTQGKQRGGKKNKRKVDPVVQHQQFRQPHKN